MPGPTSVCCPDDRLALAPGLRLRPVPELGLCLVYIPGAAALESLNTAAWLIVSLCRSRPFAEVAADYEAICLQECREEGAGAGHGEVRAILTSLCQAGILQITPAPPGATE